MNAPLDGHAARFLDMLAAVSPADAASRSVEAYRSGFVTMSAFAAPTDHSACIVEDAVLKGARRALTVRLYSPPQRPVDRLPALIYFHGGGWIAGSLDSHDSLCRLLCATSGCALVAVDYRLAPEHPFPAGVEDCCDALLALSAQAGEFGLRGDRIAVGGDSAGAHLAAIVCGFARDHGVRLAYQLMLCPVIDPFGDWPSRRAFAKGYLLEESAIADYIRFYGPSLDRADPRLSPLREAKFDKFPPADIHTAECDPVRDEGRAYAAALAEQGVPVRYTCHPGLIHNFYGLGGVIPAARQAVVAIGRDLGAALNAP